MKNKVCIIIPYFGKFPSSLDAFLISCAKNPSFEWLILTNDKLNVVPANVQVVYCTLKDIKTKIEETVGFEVSLNAPYKLCDYRPAFGQIFKEYLKDYDFWGYGDIDLIYGDLSAFITDELLEQYDKIYPCGHLSLVRNKFDINTVYTKDVVNSLDYKKVFTNDKSYIFDEYHGFNEKLIGIKKRIYGCIEFADMDIAYKRFRTADIKTISMVFPEFLFKKYIPKNYRQQVFCYDDGRAYRIYVNYLGKIEKQELAYIHYRYKIPCEIEVNENTNYYLTNNGFIEKNGEITFEEIVKMNPYPGVFVELCEYLVFLKEQCIYKIGQNRKLRNIIRVLKGKKRLE